MNTAAYIQRRMQGIAPLLKDDAMAGYTNDPYKLGMRLASAALTKPAQAKGIPRAGALLDAGRLAIEPYIAHLTGAAHEVAAHMAGVGYSSYMGESTGLHPPVARDASYDPMPHEMQLSAFSNGNEYGSSLADRNHFLHKPLPTADELRAIAWPTPTLYSTSIEPPHHYRGALEGYLGHYDDYGDDEERGRASALRAQLADDISGRWVPNPAPSAAGGLQPGLPELSKGVVAAYIGGQVVSLTKEATEGYQVEQASGYPHIIYHVQKGDDEANFDYSHGRCSRCDKDKGKREGGDCAHAKAAKAYHSELVRQRIAARPADDDGGW